MNGVCGEEKASVTYVRQVALLQRPLDAQGTRLEVEHVLHHGQHPVHPHLPLVQLAHLYSHGDDADVRD
jgi:hypothetical protein